MSQDLYAENQMLRRRLENYVAQAHKNERKLRRFQNHALRLISLNSLHELIQNILYPDKTVFTWDVVTLLLLDPEFEVRRILEEEGVDLNNHPGLIFADSRGDVDTLFPYSLFPLLGPYRAKYHGPLFLSDKPPSSVAVLPLVRYGRLIGSLNIGSYHIERFVKGVRTDFLEHLAAVVAICLENATNLARLKRQGLTDTLTAINNRRFFDQRLQEEMDLAYRNGSPLSCLLLDVDHFKRINDNYGHQAGDHVLREVAALIRFQLRGSDVLSRYGGEEFAALLAGTSVQGAHEVAERVRRAVAGHDFQDQAGNTFNVTLCAGTATYHPTAGEEPRIAEEVLVGHADRVLYQAKMGGRNQVISAGVITPKEDWML